MNANQNSEPASGNANWNPLVGQASSVSSQLNTLQNEVQALQNAMPPTYQLQTYTPFEFVIGPQNGIYTYATVVSLTANGQPDTTANTSGFALAVGGTTYTLSNGLAVRANDGAPGLYELILNVNAQLSTTTATITFTPPTPSVQLTN